MSAKDVVTFADKGDTLGKAAHLIDAFDKAASARPRVKFTLDGKKIDPRLVRFRALWCLSGNCNSDCYHRSMATDHVADAGATQAVPDKNFLSMLSGGRFNERGNSVWFPGSVSF